VQSGHPNSPNSYVPTPSAVKHCRKCGQSNPLEFFPRDRSRRDGRWHTCKECNGQRCRFLRWAVREHKKRELAALPPALPASRWRLEGLKSYRNTNGERLSQPSPRERFIAQQLLNKYLHKHRGPGLSQPKRALLMACAASNAKRVGDNSWSRRMKRLKGWRRQRQRELMKWLQAPPSGCGNPARRPAGHSGMGYTPASRLAGI
jgi:hypothetical protein